MFCTCFTVAVKSSFGFLDFWPFNINKPTTPELMITPQPEGNLFRFIYISEAETQPYIDAITSFLTPYDKANIDEGARVCDFNYPPTADSVCVFDKNSLGRCAHDDYSYRRGSPCVLLTLSQASFVIECLSRKINIFDKITAPKLDTNCFKWKRHSTTFRLIFKHTRHFELYHSSCRKGKFSWGWQIL